MYRFQFYFFLRPSLSTHFELLIPPFLIPVVIIIIIIIIIIIKTLSGQVYSSRTVTERSVNIEVTYVISLNIPMLSITTHFLGTDSEYFFVEFQLRDLNVPLQAFGYLLAL